MQIFTFYPLIIAVFFVFLIGWLLPKSGKTYDVFKMRLDLFPHWFKWGGGIWILVALIISIFLISNTSEQFSFFIINLNFSLFIILFSKQKEEDEFSEQIRLKSFVYAFISFVSFTIILGAVWSSGLQTSSPNFFNNRIFIQVGLSIALLYTLIYFYTTKYKADKKGNQF